MHLNRWKVTARSSRQGFSLIEILISLVVVSLAAVNITGLQKKIADQQRDNIIHSYVISLATRKMEEILNFNEVDDLIEVNNLSETLMENNQELTLHWHVTSINNIVDSGDQFKKIEMTITWNNVQGQEQNFSYSRQVNLINLSSLDSNNVELAAEVIVSALNTNEVIYFDPTMNYQKGSFVIYDSYLYKAVEAHRAGGDLPHLSNDPDSGLEIEGDGWESYGRIDNPELANYSDLRTQFSE